MERIAEGRTMGLAEDLTALADLFERGVIDRHHFEKAKARLLADDDDAPPQGASAELDRSHLPSSSPTGDVEADGGAFPSPMVSPFEHSESAGQDVAKESVSGPTSKLRGLMQDKVWLTAFIALPFVIGGIVWVIYNEVTHEPTPIQESGRAIESPQRLAEMEFVREVRPRYEQTIDLHFDPVLGLGYEACAAMGRINPSSLYELQSQVYDQAPNDEEAWMVFGIMRTASETICPEWAWLVEGPE